MWRAGHRPLLKKLGLITSPASFKALAGMLLIAACTTWYRCPLWENSATPLRA
jgi:hypothetical protein